MMRLVIAMVLLWVPMSVQHVNAQEASQAPVVVDGIVPDQQTKMLILSRLRDVYGNDRVVDRVQVESIPVPPDWGKHVAAMVTPGLRRVSAGKLEVEGQSVRISGQIVNEAQRQQLVSDLSTATSSAYTITNSLRIGGSPQGALDDALAGRIIEFQSGSAQLTTAGMRILDEMAAKVRELGDVRLQVIGHTDDVGQRQSNIALSQARAAAVRAYMASQGVDASRLSVLGKGPDEPVADNETLEGRARNRRIEFKLLQ